MEKAEINQIPENTVERLFKYRRLLLKYQYMDKPFIFSHDLARVLNVKPVLVRRDLMLLGIHGNNRKGYDVNAILELINNTLNNNKKKSAVLIGISDLGTAAVDYFLSDDSNLNIIASFDYIPQSDNKNGIPCYSIIQLPEIIKENEVSIAVVAVSTDDIESVVNILIDSGIKSVLNLSPVQLTLPENIHLEEFDLVSKLEKASYFVK